MELELAVKNVIDYIIMKIKIGLQIKVKNITKTIKKRFQNITKNIIGIIKRLYIKKQDNMPLTIKKNQMNIKENIKKIIQIKFLMIALKDVIKQKIKAMELQKNNGWK